MTYDEKITIKTQLLIGCLFTTPALIYSIIQLPTLVSLLLGYGIYLISSANVSIVVERGKNESLE